MDLAIQDGWTTRAAWNELVKLDRPARRFRSLRRSRLVLQRRNGRSLQRITSMSLKARRRSSIWASRRRISRSAADGTTKRLTEFRRRQREDPTRYIFVLP